MIKESEGTNTSAETRRKQETKEKSSRQTRSRSAVLKDGYDTDQSSKHPGTRMSGVGKIRRMGMRKTPQEELHVQRRMPTVSRTTDPVTEMQRSRKGLRQATVNKPADPSEEGRRKERRPGDQRESHSQDGESKQRTRAPIEERRRKRNDHTAWRRGKETASQA